MTNANKLELIKKRFFAMPDHDRAALAAYLIGIAIGDDHHDTTRPRATVLAGALEEALCFVVSEKNPIGGTHE